MNFFLRVSSLFHLISLLLCFGYMVIHHVYSQTTGSSNLSCIDSERFALLNFKSSLVLDSKRNLSDWTHENMDCCLWEGIRCSKAGHVVKIDLHSSRYDYFGLDHIGGEISTSLLHLSYLSYLDLSNNEFTEVPEFFGSLNRLRYLNISLNPLAGKVPQQLGNLSVLESLDLNLGYFSSEYSMQVDSMAWVAGLTSLKYLDMSYIRMASANDWVQSILKLPSLTSLYIQSSDLPFPAPTAMNSTTSLEVVDLSYVENLNLIALSPLLRGSTKLVDLTFSSFNDQPSLIPDYLVKLVSIKYLHLSRSQLEGAIPEAFSNLTNLIILDLSYNNLHGVLPKFNNLTNLKTLDLSHNDFEGVIPQTFSNFTNLKTLSLSSNRLNNSYDFFHSGSNSLQELHVHDNKLQGTLPNHSKFPNLQVLNLGKNELKGGLPPLLQRSFNLIKLDLSSNHFNETLTESVFRNLTNLQFLSLSSNSLTLNFSPTFTPPFQLQVLKLRANKLGKIFPHWLRTQENLTNLDISDSGISDNIPSWFWNMSSRLEYLNVSHNSIYGYLPPNSLSSCEFVFLSSNQFYGTLPSFSHTLQFLDVSSNAFSGGISFICGLESRRLMYLDLSNNYLSGILPNCWKNLTGLLYLNLNNNKFTGSLPNSIGLSRLVSLFLSNNNFVGKLPQSLENCTDLYLLDLGKNQFSGKVPNWIGTSVTNLVVLRLNANNFEGNITSSLCNLQNLQILDFSFNNISGIIPSCLNNFTMMISSGSAIGFNFGFTFPDDPDNEQVYYTFSYFTASVFWKGLQVEFSSKTSELLRFIDLSSNKLNGFIPEEVTTLYKLGVLNLSHNVLIGKIPSRIGQMRTLESLDLSHNLLSGEIPLSITNLTTLNYLDLSFNQLTGSIPVSTQLSTFNATRFMGNLDLCGDPLPSCQRGKNVNPDSQDTEEGDDNKFPWMYISTSFGFIVGFWGVCGTLLIKKSLADRYFEYLIYFTERLHVVIRIGLAKLMRGFTS